MKPLLPLTVLTAVTMATSGCFVYERRTPTRTVYVEQQPTVMVAPARETVITTLPSGYRTRVVRGTPYYYTRNSYYRSYPRGGYVVVPRPW